MGLPTPRFNLFFFQAHFDPADGGLKLAYLL
jgi:hypothetical protein